MLAQICVLALASRKVGVHIFKSLGGDKGHLGAEIYAKLGIAHVKEIVCSADRADYRAHDKLEVIKVSVFLGDYLFPVPLVNVDRMNVVKLLVAANCVQVGIKTVAHGEAVALERKSLPLCEGVNYLSVDSDSGHVEGNGALDTAEVIVKTRSLGYKEGGGNSL